jgi:hypothetical protein
MGGLEVENPLAVLNLLDMLHHEASRDEVQELHELENPLAIPHHEVAGELGQELF